VYSFAEHATNGFLLRAAGIAALGTVWLCVSAMVTV